MSSNNKNDSSRESEPQPHQEQPVVPTSTALTSSTRAGSSQGSKSVSAWLEMIKEQNPPLPTPSVEECEPSADIKTTLSGIQKNCLRWCLDQEASEIRGGILNNQVLNENKLQAISLVVTARDLFPKSEASGSSLKRKDRCTLLICPTLNSLHEWDVMISNTVIRKGRVLVFHGAEERPRDVNFMKYDFVITIYSTVASEYQKKLINNEETAEKAQNEVKGEIQAKKKAKITVTSLLSGTWGRIILDDPSIKDTNCLTAQSIFELKSIHKWVLNSSTRLGGHTLKDLYPPVLFLKIFPYPYFFCLDCKCQKPGSLSPCDCKHASSRHFHFWSRYIENARRDPDDAAIATNLNLKERVLKSVLFQ